MRKTFLFVETQAQVVPGSDSRLKNTVNMILSRAVVVRTPEMVGSGVILGEVIITSLFLVGNFTEVKILLSKGKEMPAFVTARDTGNNLAKLAPAELTRSVSSDGTLLGAIVRELVSYKLAKAGPLAIGDPLLVSNSRSGTPAIKVAAMFYSVRVNERWENTLNVDSTRPSGLMGSGIWNIDGQFVGVSLAARVPPGEDLQETADRAIVKTKQGNTPLIRIETPRIYGSPASTVLDFVETKTE